ncbi:hypothetical protein GQ53DRAFT_171075 [Thozetella sp. PMI_491]|nr:hypothetical protein GQ53DRAFT_171075 [Thozetella sp. PMI_491]
MASLSKAFLLGLIPGNALLNAWILSPRFTYWIRCLGPPGSLVATASRHCRSQEARAGYNLNGKSHDRTGDRRRQLGRASLSCLNLSRVNLVFHVVWGVTPYGSQDRKYWTHRSHSIWRRSSRYPPLGAA